MRYPLQRNLVLAAGILAIIPSHLSGQGVLYNPAVQPPAQFDISPPIHDLKPVDQPGMPPFVHPPRAIQRPNQTLVSDPVVQSTAPATLIPATSSNFLGVGNGFSGPAGSFSVPGAPSDANLAVGLNHILQGVNTSYAVLSKTGTVLAGPIKFATLFSSFGGCQNTYYSDPVLQYDRENDRWILSILAFANPNSGPYFHCIAVSTGGDPTGSYARYSYSFSNLPDYPKMGVWPDAYYVTYNMFNGNTFLGAQVCAYDRNEMLAGQSANAQCFMTSSSEGGLLPADLDGATAPPASAPNYLLSLASVANTLSLWTFHVDWTTPANSTFTGPTTLAVQPYNEACTSGGTCIPQSGTSTQLDSLGDRLMYRLAYRNLGAHEVLVANHSVNAGSETGVRWYEIRSPGSSPTVYQQGTYAPDSNHRWMASIGMDQSGDIGLGLSVSSSSIHPQIHYTGRLVTDNQLGQMTQGEASIIDGAGSQTTYFCFPFTCPLTRWGDYSAMRIDPSDDCTFWYTNQYIPSNGSFNWSTRIASFKFSSCGANLTLTTTGLTSSSASLTYGQSVTLTATVSPSAATGTVTFFDGANSLGTGTLSGGQATFSTSSLSAGSRSITATYNGDTSYASSTSIAVSVTVSQAGTSTTVTSGSPTSIFGQSVTFTATVLSSTSGMPTSTVTFFDGANSLGTGTLSGGKATFSTSSLSVGSHSITANYGGDSNFIGSLSSAITQTVNAATGDFTISPSPGTVSLKGGGTARYTVTISPSGGFTGTVTLGATVQPSGPQPQFSTNPITGGSGTSTMTVPTGGVARGTYTITITGTSGGLSHSTTVTLKVH
jgi:Bacterial Ig-like domain (group 3)